MIETLNAAVELVVETNVDRMVDSAVRAEYIELRRAIDRLESRSARLLVAIHHRGIPFENGAASTPAWVQWHTGQRQGEARASLKTGIALETLPLTAKAWAQGEISASAAKAICEGRPEGHHNAYGEVEEALVGYAADRNWRDLRAMISHCRRCADALDDREPADRNGFHHSRVGDRWATTGDFDDLGGSTVDAAVNAAMDEPSPDDLRSTSKRKADALVAVCRHFLDHADLPIEGAEPPHLTIGVTYETALAATKSHPATHPNLLGSSVSPSQLAELLCDCTLGRVVFGPQSQPLDVGREYRTAPRYLRRAIVARDKGCRFPGCHRKPHRCKVHHVHPWDPDGETSACNCILLCSFHHGVIHKRGWINTFDGVTYTVWKADGELVGST